MEKRRRPFLFSAALRLKGQPTAHRTSGGGASLLRPLAEIYTREDTGSSLARTPPTLPSGNRIDRRPEREPLARGELRFRIAMERPRASCTQDECAACPYTDRAQAARRQSVSSILDWALQTREPDLLAETQPARASLRVGNIGTQATRVWSGEPIV